MSVSYQLDVLPIILNGKKVAIEDNVEHVGILRSTSGNIPNIWCRISSHKKAIGYVLHTGMGRAIMGTQLLV